MAQNWLSRLVTCEDAIASKILYRVNVMNTLALPDGQTIETVQLLGIPSEKSAKRDLSGSADEVVKAIAKVVDQMFMTVIQTRTADQFRAAYEQVFTPYMQLVLSLSTIVSNIVPKAVLVRVARDSFSELEAEIREHAVASFGADMRDRAVFTVWTLRRINDLLQLVGTEGTVPDGHQEKDKEFFSFFMAHALRARFAIDCLIASMKSGKTIHPEVLPPVADMLRSAVDAYAWIKQSADLRRGPLDEGELTPVDWVDEDQQLLNESMYDMAHESV
jgi:hypothetical protein